MLSILIAFLGPAIILGLVLLKWIVEIKMGDNSFGYYYHGAAPWDK